MKDMSNMTWYMTMIILQKSIFKAMSVKKAFARAFECGEIIGN
jgi:hypothetical protein